MLDNNREKARAKAHMAFRLDERTRDRIREMAELSKLPMTDVVTAAIDALYEEKFQARRAQAEKEADRAVALMRRLEERLGPAFWRKDGVTELNFAATDDGRPIVVAGQERYLEHVDGRLMKARVQGGSLLIAPIEDDGTIGDRMAVPVGEPALN